jgi:hypothetical protein
MIFPSGRLASWATRSTVQPSVQPSLPTQAGREQLPPTIPAGQRHRPARIDAPHDLCKAGQVTETARAIHVPVAPSVKGHEGAPTGVVATVVTRHCCRNAKRGAIFQTDGAVRLGVA